MSSQIAVRGGEGLSSSKIAAFADFRSVFQARGMKRQPANSDELRQMTHADGLIDVEASDTEALDQAPETSHAPTDLETAQSGRLLWVLGLSEMPVAPEFGPWGSKLESGCLKHSNLTGGAPAHSGGEMWRVKSRGLLINAASGRYGAEASTELDGVVDVLRSSGFSVASMGFDLENPTVANRVVVGDLNWLAPL